jgi:hypothetical protein
LMRQLCRLEAKEPDYVNAKRDRPEEPSPTRSSVSGEATLSPKDVLRARLKHNQLREQSKP